MLPLLLLARIDISEMLYHGVQKLTRVVQFTWCDDFSKARNAGLEKARGQWFLYLDDDEWFIDTKEITVHFLHQRHDRIQTFFDCLSAP